MATAKVIIKGEDRLKQPLQQAQGELNNFGNVAADIGNKLKSAFTVTAILVAVEKVTQGLSQCLTAFNQADRAYKQMSISLNNSQGFNSVKNNIDQLRKITLSSKSDLEAMASELAGLGKSSDEINKISEAAVHLSNVTGKDLNSSMTTLLNTYRGTTTQLNKLGIDTSALTKEELAEGAAVDLIISKYGELSKAMAADDTAQHIKNIKDNLGDIKQSIGQIVNEAIAPLISMLDTFSENAKIKIQEVADTVTVFIQNFPTIWQNFISALGKSLENFWKRISSVDGIKSLIDGIIKIVTNRIKLIGNIVLNLATLIQEVFTRALEGLGNLAMSWITGICDSAGINISEVINSIGNWLLESPIGQIIDQVLSKVINGVKLVGTIIKNIPSILKIVFSYLGDLVAEFVRALPQTLLHTFKGIGNSILGGILNLKNSFLQTVQDALNSIGEWIQNTWVGKAMKWMGLDLGGKLANIDFGIDRTKQYEFEDKASSEFALAKDAFSGVTDIGKEMAEEITKLLNPQIEKWTAESGETIGQKLATWTAKSSDEYLEAAKENFKDIGSFLKDWGETFLGDLGDDWDALQESLTSTFTDMFGDDMGQFVDWFKEYIKELKLDRAGSSSSGSGSSGSSSSDDSGEKATLFGTVFDDFKSQAGEAGQFISRLGENMAKLGPLLGAIATALHYVIEGFMEAIGDVLETFVKFGIGPLKEFGKIIADAFIPLFESIMPSVEDSANILIEIFTLIGKVLKPIITTIGNVLGPILSKITQFLEKVVLPIIQVVANVFIGIATVIEWVGQWIGHLIASVINWAGGWLGISVKDPGKPQDLASMLGDRLAEVGSYNSTGMSSSSSEATAVQNASYTGGTTVYLNVYNYGNVIGESGMDEFALIIRDKLYETNYFGK